MVPAPGPDRMPVVTGGGRGVRAWLENKYVLLGAHALVLAALLVSYNDGRVRFPAYRVDLDVYRLGSAALLHGQALYGTLPPTGDGQLLFFTYPPFAAIVLAPLAVLPYWAACLALTQLSYSPMASARARWAGATVFVVTGRVGGTNSDGRGRRTGYRVGKIVMSIWRMSDTVLAAAASAPFQAADLCHQPIMARQDDLAAVEPWQ